MATVVDLRNRRKGIASPVDKPSGFILDEKGVYHSPRSWQENLRVAQEKEITLYLSEHPGVSRREVEETIAQKRGHPFTMGEIMERIRLDQEEVS